MEGNYIGTSMKKVKAKYVSDVPSVFFKKGQTYDGYLLTDYKRTKMIAFWFSEEEMDEAGYYALPASRFEIIE